ncbi:MAG: hypothetical protein Q9192_008066 [Flavoplaca navasiana]
MAPQTSEPFRFLDLPLEIRNIVYEYCLVVPGEIVPYPSSWEAIFEAMNTQCEKPTVALLQVSHQVRDESRGFLYGKNLWRLSLQQWHPLPTTVWIANAPFFRHITATFDGSDLAPEFICTLQTFQSHDKSSQLFTSAFEQLCYRKLSMLQLLRSQGELKTLRLSFGSLRDPWNERRKENWEMIQTLKAFRDITRRIAPLEPEIAAQPACQRLLRNLTQEPSRVTKKSDPKLWVILAGLTRAELSELLKKTVVW